LEPGQIRLGLMLTKAYSAILSMPSAVVATDGGDKMVDNVDTH